MFKTYTRRKGEKLDKILERNPQNVHVLYQRSLYRQARSDWEGAISDITKALALDPENSYALRLRGEALNYKGEYIDAIADLSEFIRQNPRNSSGYYHRAAAFLRQGDIQLAINDYTEALRINPGDKYSFYWRAIAYVQQGDLDLALSDMDQAVKFGRQDGQMYTGRARVHQLRNEITQAHNDFNRAVKLDPTEASFYYERAKFFAAQRNFDKAITNYDQAIAKANVPVLDHYVFRGAARIKTADLAGGISDYQQLTELSPETAEYWNTLCWYGCLANRAAEFLYAGEKAVTLSPAATSARDTRGLARALTGDLAGAIEDFRFFIDHFDADKWPQLYSEMRQQWVAELERGHNPINVTVLQRLLEEGQ